LARQWVDASKLQTGLCGFCPKHIAVGDRMLLVSVPGVKKQFRRCYDCGKRYEFELPVKPNPGDAAGDANEDLEVTPCQ
jgi:hypothetical protein